MKVFIIKREEVIAIFLCFILMGGVFFTYKSNSSTMPVMASTDQKIIIIDAGHGGFDPGKTGSNGEEDEKNINLKIALKLQQYLEQSGAVVIITRIDDTALDDTKKGDMDSRKNIVNESEGDILISIHQNAFTSSKVSGAQVFYWNDSQEGKILADIIQEKLKEVLDSSNNRAAKSNDNYYILKTTDIPAVIVECGFLSNPREEKDLNDEDYQDKVAWAIYLGIVEYFNE